MDSEQAKIILSAYRPGRDDGQDDPLFAEALTVMENDPALAEWFAGQMAQDAAMTGAVKSIEVPAHLRDSILSASKTVTFPARPDPWLRPIWLAAAAVLVLGLGLAFLLPRDKRPAFAALQEEVPSLTSKHQHPFGAKAANFGKIQQWLAKNGGPSQFGMPASALAASGMGCEVVSIQGAKVSLLCFESGKSHAHLYVADRAQFAHAPVVGAAPQFRQEGEYAMASWSDGNLTYILAARGDVSSIKRLL